jgi:hypothetical protein
MAGSSRRALGALLALTLASSAGCVSGQLFEATRTHEQVARYEAAWLDGERLVLDYVVELGDRQGHSRGFEARRVGLALSDLRARPEIPAERFPVTPLAVEAALVSLVSLPVLAPGEAARPGALLLRVEGDEGRPRGFVLSGGRGGRPVRFYSGALYRTHRNWWLLLPLAPVAAVADLALLPIEVVAAIPLFIVDE